MKPFSIDVPFFEIGPKAYLYGSAVLDLAGMVDEASARYRVPVIFTPQPSDLYPIAQAFPRLYLCAQHMDPLPPGRGQGQILPEAIKAAGAKGVMLNHSEKPITLADLKQSIHRARQVGLFSIVCADSIAETSAVAHLAPDIIVAEPTELIGSGTASDMDYVLASTQAVKRVNEAIYVLQGAGISTGEDVYRVIFAGADATGTSSAVSKAADPARLVDDMLRAAREAYDARTGRSGR